jgi:hypothetical protein
LWCSDMPFLTNLETTSACAWGSSRQQEYMQSCSAADPVRRATGNEQQAGRICCCVSVRIAGVMQHVMYSQALALSQSAAAVLMDKCSHVSGCCLLPSRTSLA